MWEPIALVIGVVGTFLVLGGFFWLVIFRTATHDCDDRKCASSTAKAMHLQGTCVCLERPLPLEQKP